MTLSSDVLPAPLGPMMARISPESISTLTSLSTWTAPKASSICCTCSKGALLTLGVLLGCVASATVSSSSSNYHRCLCTDVTDEQRCLECPSTPVLKDDLGLDRDLLIGAVECFYEVSVFLGYKAPPHLTG